MSRCVFRPIQPDQLDHPGEEESRYKSHANSDGLRLLLVDVRSQEKGTGQDWTQAGKTT